MYLKRRNKIYQLLFTEFIFKFLLIYNLMLTERKKIDQNAGFFDQLYLFLICRKSFAMVPFIGCRDNFGNNVYIFFPK